VLFPLDQRCGAALVLSAWAIFVSTALGRRPNQIATLTDGFRLEAVARVAEAAGGWRP